MIRKLLNFLAIGSVAAAAQPATPAEQLSDVSKIYPYVVPATYFESGVDKAKSITSSLGHGLEIALVYDLNGLVQNVRPEDLKSLGLSEDQAMKKALENLSTLSRSGIVGQRKFTGPDQKPFILFGGHWAAATCILLPELRDLGAKNLGSDELCVCIPHRDALLMFPKGNQAYRESLLKIIKDRESDGEKPLTFQLFELTPKGIVELK